MEGVIVRPLTKHTDERGWLIEAFRGDELPVNFSPAMSYVSVTRPGYSRGPHEHIDQTDLFCFIGPGSLMLRLRDNRPTSKTYEQVRRFPVGVDAPCAVLVPPGVVHYYANLGKEDAWVINYPDRLYAGKGKKGIVDEIRYEDGVLSEYDR